MNDFNSGNGIYNSLKTRSKSMRKNIHRKAHSSLGAFERLIFATLLVVVSVGAGAESGVPEDAASVVNLSLKEGQAKLEKSGYEIAESSLMGKKQLWWNEDKKTCVKLEFESDGDKKITEVKAGDKDKCIKGAAASRKVWDSYKDGQAPVSFAALDAERSTLSKEGYKASYWTKDMAPGKDSETWYNAESSKCKRIIWSSSDNGKMKTMDCKPEQGKKPGPSKG